jgi:hypothetical protein
MSEDPNVDVGALPDELRVAEIVGETLTEHLGDGLTGAASVVDMQEYQRVLLPLKGRPEHAQAQFPPPSEDTLAWVDLYRHDDPAGVPDDVPVWPRNQMFYERRYVVKFFPDDPAYVVVLGGFDWYTLGWMSANSLDVARGLIGPGRRRKFGEFTDSLL